VNRSIPVFGQFILDIGAVILCLFIAYWIRMGSFDFDYLLYKPLILTSIISYLLAFLLSGSYREYLRVPLRGHLHNGFRAFLIGSLILTTMIYLFQLGYFTRTLIIIYWLVFLLFIILTRIAIFLITSTLADRFQTIKVKILTEGKGKTELEHLLHINPLIGYRLTDDEPDAYLMIGHLDDCRKYMNDKKKIRFIPKNFMRLMKDAPLYDLPGVWISQELPKFGLALKPVWDVIFTYPIAILLTLISLPLFPVFALFIKKSSTGPVFFKQRRYSKGVKSFTLYKFRTMIEGAERMKVEANLDDDPRVTSFGSFLRRTSLDELPQLFNVLSHKMNLVGPRPLIKKEVFRYKFIQEKRLSIRAGLTGLVQVSGRKTYSLEEMTILDLYYVEHWSPLLDLELLFMTIPSILIGKGAY